MAVAPGEFCWSGLFGRWVVVTTERFQSAAFERYSGP
jgi:hypothetical protein